MVLPSAVTRRAVFGLGALLGPLLRSGLAMPSDPLLAAIRVTEAADLAYRAAGLASSSHMVAGKLSAEWRAHRERLAEARYAARAILAVIDRHNEAWSVYQVAPEGEASDVANRETFDALSALLTTACGTRFGSLALLSHLRWWLSEEAVNADGYGEHWPLAQARAADLTLFLGTPPVPAVYPQADKLGYAASRVVRKAASLYTVPAFELLAFEDAPGSIEPWQAVTPIRPDTPYSRSLRLLDGMGEAFAVLSLICGGLIVVGLASLS